MDPAAAAPQQKRRTARFFHYGESPVAEYHAGIDHMGQLKYQNPPAVDQRFIVQGDCSDGLEGVQTTDGEKIPGDFRNGGADGFGFRSGSHQSSGGGIESNLPGTADGGTGTEQFLPGGVVARMGKD